MDFCKPIPNKKFDDLIPFCQPIFDVLNEDKKNYGYYWSEYNSSYTPANGMRQVYDAFRFRDTSSLDSLSIYEEYGYYMGDGYAYQFQGKLDYLMGNMSLLQKMNWIDRQTSGIFIEFNLYNPALNLFSYSTLSFELLPSGNILSKSRFDIFNLFITLDITIGAGLAYMAFIIYFMIKEFRKIYKNKLTGLKEYFKDFWTYIRWSLIGVSWGMFAVYVYLFLESDKIKKWFVNTSGYGYLRLQYLT